MEGYTSEGYAVAGAFQKGMAAYQNEPLVLYGIGTNTQAVLNLTKGFSIVGLLDANSTGQTLYGKPVLTLEEAASRAKRIVIIARGTVTPIIFRRIKGFAEARGITIHNYAGVELKEREDAYDRSDLEYWKHSWAELKRSIAHHDVISFDLFDTLLGRYVLRPEDLFGIMEREYGNPEIHFAELRRRAERECGYAPTLDDIYYRLPLPGPQAADRPRLRRREFEWELRLTYPRRRMVEALQYAVSLGKTVFLTSDMYLSKAELGQLLAKHGITGYHRLLVSCEEKAAKHDGKLFARLLAETGGMTVLHIGDNRFCDVEAAQSMGIHTWQVWSPYELFMVSSLWPLLAEERPEPGDRLSLGMLCAALFEDPFALHETRGKVVLTRPEQMSPFLGPWALSFMQWAAEQIKLSGIEQFLYPSRDGFLFHQMSQILQKAGLMENVRHIYVKASRQAVSARSASEQTHYRKYIETTGFCPEKPTAIFDFVARGTVQYHMERLLGKGFTGLYFATVEHPNEMFPHGGHVRSAFGNITSYGGGGQLGRVYPALETILTDGDPTLVRIDARGEPVFPPGALRPDGRVLELQHAVCEWVSRYMERFGSPGISLELADTLIGALFSPACELSQAIRSLFVHDEIPQEEIESVWYRSY